MYFNFNFFSIYCLNIFFKKIIDEKRSLSVKPETNFPSPVNSIESPRSVPKTASQMIGWRSTNTIYQLEKYGPYTKGKQTITKSLRWPHEGVN